MAERCVALLRGVNVGTAKRVAMADLRALCETLGCDDVRTVLNSGNIVFTPPRGTREFASTLEQAIARRLGVETRVIVLAADDLAAAIRGNPFASIADNPSRMLIAAIADSKTAGRLKPLVKEAWTPEAFALRGRFAYLWCAHGIGLSPLWAAVNRALGKDGTARNLATLSRLAALTAVRKA